MYDWIRRRSIASAALALVFGVVTTAELAAQGPDNFLRRLDANDNGMLDPDELDGRFGYFVKRMAQNNPRLDLSEPVPIDRIAEEFARMREQRTRGRGGAGGGTSDNVSGRGGPAGGSQSGRRDRGRRDSQREAAARSSSPYRSRDTEVEPLVPGFGEEEVLTPASGFGAEAELFTVEVTDQDRREAERAFGYYDRNRDRRIDSQEMKRSRNGADLPLYDKNRDGIITMNEMEYRYARRRVENTRGQSSGNSSSRGKSSGAKGDGNSDDWLWSKRLGFEDRNSYRARLAVEQPAKGLPDWFARDDANGDGQVAMAEFSASWSDSLLADYHQFDLNRDGVVTPQECLKATQDGAVRGSNIGSNVRNTSATASSSPPRSSSSPSSPVRSRSGATPPRATNELRIDPRYMKYYQQLVAKYDENGDKHLEHDEWIAMSGNPGAADADGNGRISVEEFASWSMQR